MYCVFLTSVLAPVLFEGGPPAALAESIFAATKQPVVIGVLGNETYKRFEYDPADLNEMARAIREATGLRKAPGAEYAFHPDVLPTELVRLVAFRPQRPGAGFSYLSLGDGVKNGVVSWRANSNEAANVRSISRSNLSMKLEFHWTFEPYSLVGRVESLPERDFLKYVAKCVGGRLTWTKDSYSLQFEPEQFRQRAKNLFATVKAADLERLTPRDKSDFELSRLAIGTASAQQLSEAFASPGASSLVPVSSANIGLVATRLRAYLGEGEQAQGAGQAASSDDQGQQRGNRPVRGLASVDLRFGASIVLHSDFRVEVEAVTVDPLGRPRGKIRF